MAVTVPPEKMEEQRIYTQKAAALLHDRAAAPLAFVDTYGCQQNEADSERLRGMLAQMGCSFTQDEALADVIVINTCAVREHAEMRALGNVGALTHGKKAKPGQIIAVCGCMAQRAGMAEKIRASYRIVDLVFGPQALWRFPELLYRVLSTGKRVFSVEEEAGTVAEGIPQVRQDKIRAWLSVMYGCNNFCSYCVVPYVRGRERSRSPEAVLAEARELVQQGYKDITLLGQNVNSYGNDLAGEADFSGLIRSINEIDGDFLIRFMTSHPKDAGEKLFTAIAESPKAAHHIHLPFQSGSSRILKEMNRRYTSEQYLRLVELARKIIPDVVLTSDVIVGFPGETEEDFRQTMELIRTVRFDALFTFIYSPRPNTPAAAMPDPESKQAKQRRFEELLAAQNAISEEIHAGYLGTRQRVLIDTVTGDDKYPVSGRTNGGRLVRLPKGIEALGQFRQVSITGSNTWALFGELI